jgi:hypothetical protein
MKTKKSEFGKINVSDLLNALYYFAGSFLLSLLALTQVGVLPTKAQLITIVSTSLSAGLLNIFKNMAKNEDGSFGKKEK